MRTCSAAEESHSPQPVPEPAAQHEPPEISMMLVVATLLSIALSKTYFGGCSEADNCQHSKGLNGHQLQMDAHIGAEAHKIAKSSHTASLCSHFYTVRDHLWNYSQMLVLLEIPQAGSSATSTATCSCYSQLEPNPIMHWCVAAGSGDTSDEQRSRQVQKVAPAANCFTTSSPESL